MTDNRTTEKLLREFVDVACECEVRDYLISEYAERIEQAIAATLGSGECAQCAKDMGTYADSLCDPLKERVNELLRCLENDWHIRASWDGLRKFWNIELTEEGVRMRDATHGTLTRIAELEFALKGRDRELEEHAGWTKQRIAELEELVRDMWEFGESSNYPYTPLESVRWSQMREEYRERMDELGIRKES